MKNLFSKSIFIAVFSFAASFFVVPALLPVSTGLSISTAQAQPLIYRSCGQLWYMRNAIYARKGYCFKTARARAVFGPRCYSPYGKLNRSERRRVSAIKRAERRKGC